MVCFPSPVLVPLQSDELTQINIQSDGVVDISLGESGNMDHTAPEQVRHEEFDIDMLLLFFTINRCFSNWCIYGLIKFSLVCNFDVEAITWEIGKYRSKKQVLGRGAFGKVFEAWLAGQGGGTITTHEIMDGYEM